MKNEKFKGFILALIIIFIVSSIIANNSQLTGNDIVKFGTLQAISGKLFEEDEEWFVKADDELFGYISVRRNSLNLKKLFLKIRRIFQ